MHGPSLWHFLKVLICIAFINCVHATCYRGQHAVIELRRLNNKKKNATRPGKGADVIGSTGKFIF